MVGSAIHTDPPCPIISHATVLICPTLRGLTHSVPIDQDAIGVPPPLHEVRVDIPVVAASNLTLDFKYRAKHLKSQKFACFAPPAILQKDGRPHIPLPVGLRPCNLGVADPRRYNIPVYVSSDDVRAPNFGCTEVNYYVEDCPQAPVCCYYLKRDFVPGMTDLCEFRRARKGLPVSFPIRHDPNNFAFALFEARRISESVLCEEYMKTKI